MPGNPRVDSAIVVDGEEIKMVERFCYLGATQTNEATIDVDFQTRIAKASSAFEKLERRLWSSHDIDIHIKISVYKAVILTVLLYGAET